MLVEVSKHLLATLKTGVEEEDDGNCLVAQFGLLLESFFCGHASVLTVVGNESCDSELAHQNGLAQSGPKEVEQYRPGPSPLAGFAVTIVGRFSSDH